MAATINAVRGMNDVLPGDAALWERFEDAARDVFAQYGYRNMRVPIVETTPLFVRGIGDATDIVEREMYTFEDKLNGESLTLRPEATAGIVRAAIEHSLIYERPQRVWTSGPMFRHERPQRGRYRQFHQLDVEALGFAGPDVDAEQMVMLARLWRALGIAEGTRLKINSIGDLDERRSHRADLIAYFEARASDLDADAKRRLHTNPLRILDSKNPDMQEMIEGAPTARRAPGRRSRAHFDGLQQLLADSGIPFEIDRPPRPRARLLQSDGVRMGHRPAGRAGRGRGRRTLRRIVRAGGRQGRRPRAASRSASSASCCCCRKPASRASARRSPTSCTTATPRARLAWRAGEMLRDAGCDIVVNAGGGSFKSQMKKADASGARFAVLIGPDEAAAQTVSIKPLRESGEQRTVPFADLGAALETR